MSTNIVFTKENLNDYLRLLAKEYRKLNGKNMPAEIILVGGAAILANYGFREMTYDVDALIQASSLMKEAINHVGDSLGLPNGWLNSDFMKTKSYSPHLSQYSTYYKTFSNVLTIRTISGAYLIAMKLMSLRQYKNDISDIVGILIEQEQLEKPISMEDIDEAVLNLYGGWMNMPKDSKQMIHNIVRSDNLQTIYNKYRDEEVTNKDSLLEFNKKYPNVTNEGNVKDIITNLKARKNK